MIVATQIPHLTEKTRAVMLRLAAEQQGGEAPPRTAPAAIGRLVERLEGLGYRVTLEPRAA